LAGAESDKRASLLEADINYQGKKVYSSGPDKYFFVRKRVFNLVCRTSVTPHLWIPGENVIKL
jgi:hypothetical protein